MSTPPPRVRVTRTRRASPGLRRTVRDEIAGQSGLGTTYVSSLVRAQRQLTILVLGIAFLSLCALPLLFALVPAARRVEIAGLPVAWFALGLLVYPAVVLLARWYARASERIEADFSELVGRR